MPKIRSSADLRNNYNDISTFCHTYAEPVFITKNGKGDLAVMSIETYEELAGRFELYSKLQEGLDDVAAGRTIPLDEAMAELKNRRRNHKRTQSLKKFTVRTITDVSIVWLIGVPSTISARAWDGL